MGKLSMPRTLFDAVVEETGLNPRIAPFVVRRVCATLGFPAATMNHAQLLQSMDALGAAIRVYKPATEAEQSVERLRRLAASVN